MMQSLAIGTAFPVQPRSLVTFADAPKKPEEEPEDKGDFYQRVSRVVSGIGNGIAKVPKALRFVPEFLRFAVFDALVPMVQLTAGIGGIAAFIGAGVSGVLEIVDGVKDGDPVKVLSGAGETSRGLFLGTVTGALLIDKPLYRSTLGTAGHIFSYGTGAFALAAGVMKYRHGVKTGDKTERTAGLLEMGIGACSIAATQGTLLYPAIALQSALVIGRTWVVNHDKIIATGKKVGKRLHTSWDHFKDLFRKHDDAPPKSGDGACISPSQAPSPN